MSLRTLYSLSSLCPWKTKISFSMSDAPPSPSSPLLYGSHVPFCLLSFFSLHMPSSNNHISFQLPFLFSLPDECRQARVTGGYSNLERRLLFFICIFFLPCARQCCYHMLSSSTWFLQLNFVLAMETATVTALKLLLLFNFPCIASHPVADALLRACCA